MNPPYAAEEWWLVNHTTHEYFVHRAGTTTYRRIRMCVSTYDEEFNITWRKGDFIVWYNVSQSENRTSYNIVNYYSHRFNPDQEDDTDFTRLFQFEHSVDADASLRNIMENNSFPLKLPDMCRDYTVSDADRKDYIKQMSLANQ